MKLHVPRFLWPRWWPAFPLLAAAAATLVQPACFLIATIVLFVLPGYALWCAVGAALARFVRHDRLAMRINAVLAVLSGLLTAAGGLRFHI